MIKKRRPVSCPNLAAGRPYFANYMNTTQDTALLDTSIESIVPVVVLSTKIARYDHFEVRYGQ